MRKLIYLIMTACLSSQVVAAPPRTDLGRLFFSGDERAAIDRLRRNKGQADEPGVSLPQQAEPITINGLVRREGGKSTAWIGESMQYERESRHADRIAVPRPGGVAVRLADGKEVRLKVGQTYDPAKGVVKDMVEPAGGRHQPEGGGR